MNRQRWVSEKMTVAGASAAAWVAAALVEAPAPLPSGDRVGLYLATPDSGSREALAFWRAAHETGVALAAPAAFPWTLSNSVTGRVSAALGITGPCSTWVGGEEARAEAELTALEDLADGLVDLAVVVAFWGEEPPDAVGSPVRLHLTASVLAEDDLTPSDPGFDGEAFSGAAVPCRESRQR